MRKDHSNVPSGTKALSKGNAFSSIQGRLVGLLLLVLVPILLAQAHFSYDRYQSRKRIESEANLDLARATAKAFDTFVHDVLHQELAIGLDFTSSQTLSEKEKTRILLDIQAGNPAIWHLFWDNPAGIVTAATGSQFIGMDISDREFYREIVAGKDWVVSDLLLSKTTHQPSFTISRGIRNERGELLGIIVAGILPGKLDRVLGVNRPGDAGVSLLDSKGMHVYRYPATQYTWEERNWLKHYPVIGEVLKGKEVVTSVEAVLTGINRIMAFTPVPSVGWVATCSRAEEEVVRPIISAIIQETGLTLLVAFVSLLIAVVLSRTISTSVIILRNYAVSLGQGGPQNPLTIAGPAEIKDLADSFNKMAEEICFRENALQTKEAELLEAQRMAHIGSWHWDAQTDITIGTDELLRIYGFDPATQTIPNFKDQRGLWNPPEEWDRLNAAAQESLRTGTGYDLEVEALRNGQCIWVQTRSEAVCDSEGRIVGLRGTVQDITESKRTEEALRQRAEEIERLLEAVPVAVWVARDPQCLNIIGNRKANKFYEAQAEENVSATTLPEIRRFFTPDGRELTAEQLPMQKAVASNQDVLDSELQVELPSGRRIIMLGSAVPLRDQQGNARGCIGAFMDITDRKKTEEALRESDLKYNKLFHSRFSGLAFCEVVVDEQSRPVDYKFLDVNDAFEGMTGLQKEMVVGRTARETMPGIENSKFDYIRVQGNVALTGEETTFETYQEYLDRWFFFHVYSPKRGFFVSIFSDITERKQAEEQIKASLAEKEVMLREIHHRVKNNLQVISSLISLQAAGLTDERMQGEFNDVRDRVRSMALIHEKLYQTSNLAQLNFADYAASLLSSLWRSHGNLAAKVRLNLEIAPVVLSIDAAVPCGLILNELAGNALKHAFPNGRGGEVTVGMEYNPSATVCLRVHDNGVGLPIGMDWQQSSSLGLRLVRILAGQVRGSVETGIGPGAEFQITFPLNEAQA